MASPQRGIVGPKTTLLRELIPRISRVLVPSFLAAARRPRFHEVGVVRELSHRQEQASAFSFGATGRCVPYLSSKAVGLSFMRSPRIVEVWSEVDASSTLGWAGQSRACCPGQASTSAEAEGRAHVAADDLGRAAIQGFLNENGRPFAAASVKSMLV